MVYPLNNIEFLESLYSTAYLIRNVELEIAKKYSEGKMRCPVHLSVGQELTSTVFSFFSKQEDYAVSSHRAHAHYLAKGGNLQAMIAEIYGKETGCSKGRGGSMHLSDPNVNFMGSSAIVGNSIPIGVGLAYGIKLKKINRKSFIFFGDGATEEGIFYESLNFAIVHKLPAIFVCENNFYSVYTNLQPRQPSKEKIYQRVNNLGIKSYFVNFGDIDGTIDVFQSIDQDFYNEPVFIEIETYRWLEHCGPNSDDNLNYRSEKEVLKFISFDVVFELKKKILNLNPNSLKKLTNIEKNIDSRILSAFEFAESSPFPSKNSSMGDFYI